MKPNPAKTKSRFNIFIGNTFSHATLKINKILRLDNFIRRFYGSKLFEIKNRPKK